MSHPPSPWRRGIALVVPAAAGFVALALTWHCWVHPTIDNGRELNSAARIASGEQLYARVPYYFGPLPVLIDAVGVRLAGQRFWPFYASNLAITALLLVFLYRLVRTASNSFCAEVVATSTASVCLGEVMAKSFILPYSKASLIALTAALAAIHLFTSGVSRKNSIGIVLAMSALLLSRPDLGIEISLAMVLAAFLRGDRGIERQALLAITAGALIAAGGYVLAFRHVDRHALMARSPLFFLMPWRLPPAFRLFYRRLSLGPTSAPDALIRFLLALAFDALILGTAWVLARHDLRRRFKGWTLILWTAALIGAGAFAFAARLSALWDWLPSVLLPLPILTAVAALAGFRRHHDNAQSARFLLFSLGAMLGLRVALSFALRWVRVYVVIAFPCLIAAAAILVMWCWRPIGSDRSTLRAELALVFLAITAFHLLRVRTAVAGNRFLPVRTAAGTVRLPADQGRAIAGLLGHLQRNSKPGDELAAFPEGGFFNFVTGLKNPLPYEQLTPALQDVAEVRNLATGLATTLPRFVLIANRPTSEYGPTAFGRDYDREIQAVIDRRYRLVQRFGAAPADASIGDSEFFVKLFERAGGGGAKP